MKPIAFFIAISLTVVFLTCETASFAIFDDFKQDIILDLSVHTNTEPLQIEYHNFISKETIPVNAQNSNDIITRIENDKHSGVGDKQIIPIDAIESNKRILSFNNNRGITSTDTLYSINSLSSSPYSGVCQIFTVYKNSDNIISKMTLSSGCFISENSILTAAHCLHDTEYGSPSTIRIYYCFRMTDALGNSFGNLAFCSAVSSIYCTTYDNNNDTMYDYGIINVASFAGTNTGVFKLATITPTTSLLLKLIGYPSAISSDGYGSDGNTILTNPNPLRYSIGKLDKVKSDYLRAKRSSITGEPGMSGGALTTTNNGVYELLGVYTARRKNIFGIEFSYFCRINSNVMSFCATYGGTNNVPSSLYLS